MNIEYEKAKSLQDQAKQIVSGEVINVDELREVLSQEEECLLRLKESDPDAWKQLQKFYSYWASYLTMYIGDRDTAKSYAKKSVELYEACASREDPVEYALSLSSQYVDLAFTSFGDYEIHSEEERRYYDKALTLLEPIVLNTEGDYYFYVARTVPNYFRAFNPIKSEDEMKDFITLLSRLEDFFAKAKEKNSRYIMLWGRTKNSWLNQVEDQEKLIQLRRDSIVKRENEKESGKTK